LEGAVPQIDHVICPVDLTDPSTRALTYAFAWARWYGAQVHVVHVSPLAVVAAPLAGVAVTLDQRPASEILRDVEQYVARVPNPGVPVDIQVNEGDAPVFIRKHAERYQRAVIVMGSHGRTGLERFVMGSVAERVVGSGVAPVLVVPPHDAHPETEPVFHHILCAVDLLPSSMEGLRYAMSLAREADAVLEVVYVAEDAGAEEVQLTQHFRVPEYVRQRAEESLQEIRQHIPAEAREGCTIHERVIYGTPATAILQAARDSKADVIVMGAGDRAHLRSLWLGSTTSRIAHDAGCPMLIVPTPAILRRAADLEAQPVAREYWRDTFERVSLQHQGDPASVSVMSPGFAAPEAKALPLIGVTMDLPPSNDIAVILGTPGGAHISHVIPRPTEVLLDEAHTHAVTRLLVRSADGTSTLVEVTRKAGSTMAAVAEARIQL
jgi:nucleotide-binding universal stress UspA family protein